jgi:hypothetical protein
MKEKWLIISILKFQLNVEDFKAVELCDSRFTGWENCKAWLLAVIVMLPHCQAKNNKRP